MRTTDTLKCSEPLVYNHILDNIVLKDTITMEEIYSSTFTLSKNHGKADYEKICIGLNKNKIIVNQDPTNKDYVDDFFIINPYTQHISKKIDFLKLSKLYTDYNQKGVHPENTYFFKNINNEIITEIIETSFYTYNKLHKTKGDYYQKSKIPKLFIEYMDSIYFNDVGDYFFYREKLFHILDVDTICSIINKDTVYSITSSKKYFIYIVNNTTLFNDYKFRAHYPIPLQGKLYFIVVSKICETKLYAYDIKNKKTDLYIIPICSNEFYLTKDGFFFSYGEIENRRENTTYSFIPFK